MAESIGRKFPALRVFRDVRLSLRCEYLFFTLALPLLGAASSAESATFGQVTGIFLVAFTFHAHIALINDVIDLPIDRGNPKRADYPLVRGALSPKLAVTIAALVIIIPVVWTVWQSGVGLGLLFLTGAVVLMLLYNMWGKRSLVPLIMDVAMGAGFGALVLYGATLFGDLHARAFVVAALVVVWSCMMNLFGGLRDLITDTRRGALTTPIALGVTECEQGLLLSRSFLSVIHACNLILYGTLIWVLAEGSVSGSSVSAFALVATTAAAGINFRLVQRLPASARQSYPAMMLNANLIMALSSAAAILVFALWMGGWFIGVTMLLYLWAMPQVRTSKDRSCSSTGPESAIGRVSPPD